MAGAPKLKQFADNAEILRRDGSVALTGALDANNNTITGLPDPVAGGDAANKSWVSTQLGQVAGLDSKYVLQPVNSGDFADPDATTVNVSATAEFDFANTAGVLGTADTDGGLPVLLEEAGGADAGDFNSTTGLPAPTPAVAEQYLIDVYGADGSELLDAANNDQRIWAVITAVARAAGSAYTLRFFSGEPFSGNEQAATVGVAFRLVYPQIVTLSSIGRGALLGRTALVSAEAAQLAAGQVDAAHLAANSVTTAKIADDNVTTAKILDANVTAAKLAPDAVTTAKILDANVTTAKIADDAVTTAKILDANVTAAKLGADAVTTAKILDANVTEAKIADDAVTAAKIAGGIVAIGLHEGDAGDTSKAMSAAGTIEGANQETAVDIAAAPMNRVLAVINGVTYPIGLDNAAALYFAATGDGANARGTWGAVQAGDKLFVNTATLGFTLDTTDDCTLVYAKKNA